MNLKMRVTILLVIFVFGGECRIHSGEERVHDGEGSLQFHGVEASAQKRMVHKKGDHLFNNIAKGFTNMIEYVFTDTPLKFFCRVSKSENSLMITDKDSGNDMTNQFPLIIKAYRAYKTDKLLTTDRDKLAVYGKKKQGQDKNSLKWGKTMENLRHVAIEFIGKLICAKFVWLFKRIFPSLQNEVIGNNGRTRFWSIMILGNCAAGSLYTPNLCLSYTYQQQTVCI